MGFEIPPTGTVIRVGPSLAADILEMNKCNRTLSNRTVARLAKDMRNGKWLQTGETLKFATDNTLRDGQHRLWAVLESETEQDFLVASGLDPDAQLVMDTGRRRTAANALEIAMGGSAYSVVLAAVARVAIGLEADPSNTSRAEVTHSDVISWVQANPEIAEVASKASKYSTLPFGISQTTYALWKLRAIDSEQAAVFFDAMYHASTEGPGDPRYTLLKRFETARKQRELIPYNIQVIAIFRAWNAWRKDEKLWQLRLKSTSGDWSDVKINWPI